MRYYVSTDVWKDDNLCTWLLIDESASRMFCKYWILGQSVTVTLHLCLSLSPLIMILIGWLIDWCLTPYRQYLSFDKLPIMVIMFLKQNYNIYCNLYCLVSKKNVYKTLYVFIVLYLRQQTSRSSCVYECHVCMNLIQKIRILCTLNALI